MKVQYSEEVLKPPEVTHGFLPSFPAFFLICFFVFWCLYSWIFDTTRQLNFMGGRYWKITAFNVWTDLVILNTYFPVKIYGVPRIQNDAGLHNLANLQSDKQEKLKVFGCGFFGCCFWGFVLGFWWGFFVYFLGVLCLFFFKMDTAVNTFGGILYNISWVMSARTTTSADIRVI